MSQLVLLSRCIIESHCILGTSMLWTIRGIDITDLQFKVVICPFKHQCSWQTLSRRWFAQTERTHVDHSPLQS